jgi:hypothetical protein
MQDSDRTQRTPPNFYLSSISWGCFDLAKHPVHNVIMRKSFPETGISEVERSTLEVEVQS